MRVPVADREHPDGVQPAAAGRRASNLPQPAGTRGEPARQQRRGRG
jgi:hypothetical protein